LLLLGDHGIAVSPAKRSHDHAAVGSYITYSRPVIAPSRPLAAPAVGVAVAVAVAVGDALVGEGDDGGDVVEGAEECRGFVGVGATEWPGGFDCFPDVVAPG
jgi:hypothetical protein